VHLVNPLDHEQPNTVICVSVICHKQPQTLTCFYNVSVVCFFIWLSLITRFSRRAVWNFLNICRFMQHSLQSHQCSTYWIFNVQFKN